MRDGESKIAWIEHQIANGRTVYVHTYGHATKVTPATYAKWQETGRPLFKVGTKSGHLLMASGKSYVDASYADLQAL